MEFNGTFLATIITFIVFVFVMNKVLYAPILGIMEKRENFINTNYKDAENNNNKANELESEKEAKLNDAKDEARGKYVEKVDEFKAKREEIIADAQKLTKDELEKSKMQLQNVSDEVKDNLKNSMDDLANDIVEKVIGYRSEIKGFDSKIVDGVLWGEEK